MKIKKITEKAFARVQTNPAKDLLLTMLHVKGEDFYYSKSLKTRNVACSEIYPYDSDNEFFPYAEKWSADAEQQLMIAELGKMHGWKPDDLCENEEEWEKFKDELLDNNMQYLKLELFKLAADTYREALKEVSGTIKENRLDDLNKYIEKVNAEYNKAESATAETRLENKKNFASLIKKGFPIIAVAETLSILGVKNSELAGEDTYVLNFAGLHSVEDLCGMVVRNAEEACWRGAVPPRATLIN